MINNDQTKDKDKDTLTLGLSLFIALCVIVLFCAISVAIAKNVDNLSKGQEARYIPLPILDDELGNNTL